jgi:acetate kinase
LSEGCIAVLNAGSSSIKFALYDAASEGPEDLLYRKSGLLGVSGISSDLRALRQSTAPEAAEAIALFAYRIVGEIGSLAAALGGLDGLVFTAGIGEHARNRRGDGRISTDGSTASA